MGICSPSGVAFDAGRPEGGSSPSTSTTRGRRARRRAPPLRLVHRLTPRKGSPMLPTLPEARARLAAAGHFFFRRRRRRSRARLPGVPPRAGSPVRLEPPDSGPVYFPLAPPGSRRPRTGSVLACSGLQRFHDARNAHRCQGGPRRREVDVARRPRSRRTSAAHGRPRPLVRHGPSRRTRSLYLAGPFCAPEEAARLVPTARHVLAVHFPETPPHTALSRDRRGAGRRGDALRGAGRRLLPRVVTVRHERPAEILVLVALTSEGVTRSPAPWETRP